MALFVAVLIADKPLLLVSYECDIAKRGDIEPIRAGDPLLEMPLFLGPNRIFNVPVEQSDSRAWQAVPQRWKRVIRAT